MAFKKSLSTLIRISLLFFILTCSCQKKNNFEKLLNDCYFQSMPNKGEELIKYYKEYEAILISNGTLKDNSAESYRKLNKRVISEDFFDTKTTFSFIDSINKLSYHKLVNSNQKCIDDISRLKGFEKSRVREIQKLMDSVKNITNLNPDEITNYFFSIIDKTDFGLDIYKVRTLLLTERTNEITSKVDGASYNLENSLKILLNPESKIIVNNTIVNNIEFRKLLENHLTEIKPNSLIVK